MLVGALAGAGCSAGMSPVDQGGVDLSGLGCTKDSECKGDRICVEGRCVSPGGGEAGGPADLSGTPPDVAGSDGVGPGQEVDYADLVVPGDQSPSLDIGADLAVPDLATGDSSAPDLARSPDLVAPDLAAPDLIARDFAGADLASGDLAKPDLAAPDLARPPDLGGRDAGGGGVASCSKRFGDNSDQQVLSTAFDPSGNVFFYGSNGITGSKTATIDLGGGPITTQGGVDLFLAKFDGNCKLVWAKGFGSANDDWGEVTPAMAVDALGNVIITGSIGGPATFGGAVLPSTGRAAFLAKFDPAGKHLFSQSFPAGQGADSAGTSVATDPAGEIGLAGKLNNHGSINLGGGALTDARDDWCTFFAKFDAQGTHRWSHLFCTASAGSFVTGWALALDSTGAAIGSALQTSSTDLGGGKIGGSGFVVKFDTAGVHQWSISTGSGTAYAIAMEANDDPVAAGGITQDWDFGNGVLKAGGTADTFLVRLAGNTGSAAWSRRFGKAGVTGTSSVAVDGAGEILLGGIFNGSADFGSGLLITMGGYDMFIARFDPGGGPIWSARYGDAADQSWTCVAGSSTGRVAAGGAFLGTLDFGNGPLVDASRLTSDAWIAMFAN